MKIIFKPLETIGKISTNFLSSIGEITILFINIHKNLYRVFRDRKLILKQMEHIGVNSIPLVLIIALFTGAVSAWQAAYQLKGLAPLSFIGGATTRAIITELGPVLTGIVIAGRVGASIAAEIGTMKVTEQIDALETMSINPIRYLAMPRYVASLIMIPILIVYANLVATIGSFVVSNFFLGISSNVFFESVRTFFSLIDYFYGIVKGMIFGVITSLIGCYVGFKTEGGAEGVGLATIRAFVFSSASILVFDYILWNLFY